jgi:hypothetical protein
MGTGLVPYLWRWLGRAVRVLVALTILATFSAGCSISGGHNEPQPSENAPCDFGALVLVPVVCVRAEPARHPDGTWAYPLSNPKAARLHPGSILVVARKSVRRVESVQRVGDQVILTTAAVPLTEVVKDGRIPLDASVTPSSVDKTLDQPPGAPPPEPLHPTVSPSGSTPVSTPSSTRPAPPPVTPVVSASVRTVLGAYTGPCSAAATSAGQGPTFEATISVSGGPVTVAFHWTLTDPKGSTTPVPDTLSFPGTGPQTGTADYSVPVDHYGAGTTNDGHISLQVDSPRTTAAPEHLSYEISCASASPSPSPSPSPSTSSSRVASGDRPVGYQPANLLAAVTPPVDGYDIEPSLTLARNAFVVDVVAKRHVGPAMLTWKVHGELKNFLSRGALHIVDHQLRDSRIDITRLRGRLRFDWSLSAAVPETVSKHLSLDLPIRLFVEPLLVGDFPVFLTVEIHFNVGPEFMAGQLLHGYAWVSFSGGQGLRVHLRAIDRPSGPSIGGLHLDPGIRDLLRLPTLKASVQFPYLSLGDDLYSTGAWLWTSPRVEISIAPGHNPSLCARADADADASVGTEFQLFGLRDSLSTQVYDHPLTPAVSFPRSPECMTS